MISGDCLCVFQIPGNPLSHNKKTTTEEEKNDSSFIDKKTFSKKIVDTYPYQPMAFPLFLQIYFYMPIVKNQKKKAISGDLHTLLPDLQDCVQFIMDALNGIIWKNEKFICGLQTCKIFDENPHTLIRVLDAKTVKFRYNG